MQTINPSTTLAQTFCPVKPINSLMSITSPNPMIHHKPRVPGNDKLIVSYNNYRGIPYGVSRSQRILSPGLFMKRFDDIRDCLKDVVGLTVAQREVALRLLRYWAYYGYVYPKAAQVAEDPGCSKATYWRTIRTLKELALVTVVNRYVMRPHAQISNLYRLDRLVLLLARYLAERGVAFSQPWLTRIFAMPGRQFWTSILPGPGDRAGPGVLVSGDL